MLFAGTVLQSRYIVGKVLGFGGFGITYKAYDTKLERMVAIKEYYPAGLVYRTPGTKDVVVFKGKRYKDYADGLKRFLDEARNATKFLDNPYIVDVMEFFEENSTAETTAPEGQTVPDETQAETAAAPEENSEEAVG